MKFFVKFEVFPTITGVSPEMARLRENVGKAIGRVMQSGKVESGGILTNIRGGYFVLKDIATGEELLELLGGELLDNCKIETYPVTSFEALGDFFRRHPAG